MSVTPRMRLSLVVSAYRAIIATCQILHRVFPTPANDTAAILTAALLTVAVEMTLPEHSPTEIHAWLDTAIHEWDGVASAAADRRKG